jgi:hypothetical protein
MGKFALAALLAVVTTCAAGESCVPPSPDSPALYRVLASLPRGDLRTALDEYAFRNRWTRHAQAVAGGFRYGDAAYGHLLQRDGQFDPQDTAAWKRKHERSQARARLRLKLGALADPLALDPVAVRWLLSRCLRAATWSELKATHACRFEFRAGLRPEQPPGPPARPVVFSAKGARCAAWPDTPLSAKGVGVACVRSGGGAVVVELVSDTAEPVHAKLPALALAADAAQPLQREKASKPGVDVITLQRAYHFRPVSHPGRGCPACRLYAADVRPSRAGAIVLEIATVSSNGRGWHRCPAGLRCGVYEFSPPDAPTQTGCAGHGSCRVWRLAEGEGDASDVIQLKYQVSDVSCVNCPEGMDYGTALKRWQEAKAKKAPCPLVGDAPPQRFRAARAQ